MIWETPKAVPVHASVGVAGQQINRALALIACQTVFNLRLVRVALVSSASAGNRRTGCGKAPPPVPPPRGTALTAPLSANRINQPRFSPRLNRLNPARTPRKARTLPVRLSSARFASRYRRRRPTPRRFDPDRRLFLATRSPRFACGMFAGTKDQLTPKRRFALTNSPPPRGTPRGAPRGRVGNTSSPRRFSRSRATRKRCRAAPLLWSNRAPALSIGTNPCCLTVSARPLSRARAKHPRAPAIVTRKGVNVFRAACIT